LHLLSKWLLGVVANIKKVYEILSYMYLLTLACYLKQKLATYWDISDE